MRSLPLLLLVCLFLGLSPAAEGSRKGRSRRPSTFSTDDALQKILFYEDKRISRAPYLVQALSHSSSTVRRAALLALGRIGDPSGLDEMARILTKKDVALRRDAAFALSLIPNENAAKILSQNLPMHKDLDTRAALIENIGRSGNEGSVRFLAEALAQEGHPRLLPALYEGLGLLWSKESESWAVPSGLMANLGRAAKQKSADAWLAAFALSRYRGDAGELPAAELLEALQLSPGFEVTRALSARAVARTKTPAAAQALLAGLAQGQPQGVRVESVKGLAQAAPTPELLGVVGASLSDPSAHVMFETLQTLNKWGAAAAPLSPALVKFLATSRSLWLKGTALQTLCGVDPAAGRAEVTKWLANPASPQFADAVRALGALAQPQDIALLNRHVESPDVTVAAAAAEGLCAQDDSKLTPESRPALLKALGRGDPNLTTLISQVAGQRQWKEFGPALVANYAKLSAPEHLEARIATLSGLGLMGDPQHAPFVLNATNDRERLVVEAAVRAYYALTGQNLGNKVPLNSKIDGSTPGLSALRAAVRNRVELNTTRGTIRLKMVADAPMTALNFVRLVRTRFYQNQTFHRVVPNFVVQGGDPRGDGFGGPGYFIRDEVSPVKHDRGTVGMATAGKDTGGSQFFINLSPNYHLNGRYTVFAEVIEGMSVADRLEVGDRILSAKAY